MLVAGHSVSLPAVIALGVVVGYVAGMFGVGGGFLLTPLLAAVFGVPLPVAVGTGLCMIIGTATVGLLRHQQLGQGEVRFDLLLLGGSLFGVDAGARVLAALARRGAATIGGRAVPWVNLVVDPVYIVLLLGAAALFWVQGGGAGRRRPAPPAAVAGEPGRPGALARIRLGPSVALPTVGLRVSALVVAQLGFALGFLSGLLGIGGGVALMPVLVYGYGFPIQQAAGTGIVVLLCTAAFGTVVHALRGDVDLRLTMALLVGSTISAQLGARATRRMSAARLRRAFALVVLATVAAVAWDLVRRLA
jgi:uncharacterized protein